MCLSCIVFYRTIINNNPNACHSFIRHIRSTEFDITHALFRAHQLLIPLVSEHIHAFISFFHFSIHVLLFLIFLCLFFIPWCICQCATVVFFSCANRIFLKNAYQYVTLFREIRHSRYFSPFKMHWDYCTSTRATKKVLKYIHIHMKDATTVHVSKYIEFFNQCVSEYVANVLSVDFKRFSLNVYDHFTDQNIISRSYLFFSLN